MGTNLTPVRRRLRYEQRSTGKRVEPTDRDVLWFQKLHQHGPLPSNYLIAFTKDQCRSDTRSLERLGDLYHESSTPHGGPYLNRPSKQWSAISKFERTVYENTPAAEQVLRERGFAICKAARPKALYHHRLMVACITASMELAVRANPSLRFISEQEILARSPNKTTAVPCSISYTNPRTGKRQTLEKPLVPDAVSGIEYTVGGRRLYRFFMVEADRNQEPIRRADLNETSYLRKVLQYREVIGRGLYRKHFGMKSSMLVLNITTNFRHRDNLLDLVEELEGPCSHLLFQVAPEHGDELQVPDPSGTLLSGAWQRAGCPEMRIDQAAE